MTPDAVRQAVDLIKTHESLTEKADELRLSLRKQVIKFDGYMPTYVVSGSILLEAFEEEISEVEDKLKALGVQL